MQVEIPTMKLNGPGKYDDECKLVMMGTNAVAVFMIVVEGHKGNGVSFKTLEPALMHVMPAMLEKLAAEMRADAQKAAN